MEEVNKGGPSRPDFSHIRLFSSPIHDKDSSFEAFLICASSILDSSVDDGDVSISVSDIFHFLQRKLVLVDREVFIVDHVIDICPDGVQGKSILLVVGQDIEKFIGIRIPISALMETETPERRQFGLAWVKIEFFDCRFRALFTQEEPEVKNSTDDLVCDGSLGGISRFDDIHGVGVPQIVDMEKVVPFSEEIERIVSISLKSWALIDRHCSISIENGPLTVFLSESLLEAFSKPIKILRINCGSDFEVVVTEDEVVIKTRKKNSSILFSGDLKVERGISVLEVNGWGWNGETKVGEGVDREYTRLRHFESFVGGVCDFESEVIKGEGVEGEEKSFGDGAGWFEIIIILTCILEVQNDGGSIFGWTCDSVAGDGKSWQDEQSQDSEKQNVSSEVHKDISSYISYQRS